MNEPKSTDIPAPATPADIGRKSATEQRGASAPGGLSDPDSGHGEQPEIERDAVAQAERKQEGALLQDRTGKDSSEACTDGPAAGGLSARNTVAKKAPRFETAVGKMDLASKIRTPIDLKLEFRYALVDLLGGPQGRRIAVQLIEPSALAIINTFVERKFPIEPSNVLRRFLAGEFTDGIKPVRIPTLQGCEIEKFLRVLDVIEGMAMEHFDFHTLEELTENQDDAHSNTTGGTVRKRHHGGDDRRANSRRGRQARADNPLASSN